MLFIFPKYRGIDGSHIPLSQLKDFLILSDKNRLTMGAT